ncbi:type I-F CRISPR-associated protein Csy3 [Vibrio diazotrophicus]|uniref:type I-F CRISPR-associated protein Csy3 n=1 Tax=Vibrio diazotrophicus TaxID=685 RepID=UPI000C9E7D28|nr:type I-F CRISPR-associated protein Csy3 [Vibrio diazotrophicus]PNH79169.1 type I-F CRISPR-associated protein Csy3 [Vibrio diazotrophicus]
MKLPNNLSYMKSIAPSDVVFFVNWPDGSKTPLQFTSRVTLGMMEGSARAYKDNGEIDKNISEYYLAQGNPHEIDYCCVPYGAESIECEFSVSFTSHLRKPFKCSDPEVKGTLIQLIKLYEENIGWNELATRYLENICSGRWLWKNTETALSVSIYLKPWPWKHAQQIISFEDIRQNYTERGSFKKHQSWDLLIKLICDSFLQSNGLCLFEVSATMLFGKQAHLYPSQQFKESIKGEKSRVYQTTLVNGQVSPIIGCYKAGAAIATIDNWYPDAEEPIRISHYGAHKHDIYCYRHPKTGKDLFTLLENIDTYIKQLNTKEDLLPKETIHDLHFIVANLIKGGLFQRKGK